MDKDTLNLVLKANWYELIKAGIKKEEYREITNYWERRLCFFPYYTRNPRNFITVCFHKGYTKENILLACEGIEIGTGRPEWGAKPGKKYFKIKLGKEIKK